MSLISKKEKNNFQVIFVVNLKRFLKLNYYFLEHYSKIGTIGIRLSYFNRKRPKSNIFCVNNNFNILHQDLSITILIIKYKNMS